MEDSLCESLMNVSDAVATSTPSTRRNVSCVGTPRRASNRRSALGVFKVPKVKARKGPICGICDICGKDYVRKKSFDDHMRLHALVDANSRLPDAARLITEIPAMSTSVLNKMSKTEAVGTYGPEHNEFVADILNTKLNNADWLRFSSVVAQKIIDAVVSGKVLLPSALLPAIYKTADKILTCVEERDHLCQYLQNISEEERSLNMLQCFICEFVHSIGEEVVIVISKSVVGEKPKKPKVHVDFDIEDRQTIFFVGGSVMRGFLRKGFQYKKNEEWKAICSVIKDRVEEGNGVPLAAQADRAWTYEQNRKSLFFIGAPAMDFFVALTQVLYNIDSDAQGGFLNENVMSDVYEDSVTVVLWDELIGSTLSENLSIRFLKGVVKSFTQAYGRGAAAKKLNNHLKKAFAAITLRHAVAPRQST